MANSTDDTKDLDSYGVWVKRPPQDAASGEFDIDADIPDFSDIDASLSADADSLSGSEKNGADADFSVPNIPDGAPSADDFTADGSALTSDDIAELSDIAEKNTEQEDGEISLDDFMTDGFSDPNPQSGGAEAASSGGAEEISLDDFFDDGPAGDAPKAAKEDDVANDAPLDIDLSFAEGETEEIPTEANEDDGESAAEPDADSADSAGGAEESVAAEFDDMFDTLQEESASDAGDMQDVPLDDFGAAGEDSGAATPPPSADTGTEEVDLSDFGIDENAEETPVTNMSAKPKSAVVDYELSVTEEDKVSAAPVISEVRTADSQTADAQPAADTAAVSNRLLEQIVADLSGLKNEINSLKDDFARLKAGKTVTPAAPAQEEPVSGAEESAADAAVPSGEVISDAAAEAAPEIAEEIPSAADTAEPDIVPETAETPAEENAAAMPETAAEISPEAETAAEDGAGGFFGSDDTDETIALSGDELDNIMNTAEFSTPEEPAADGAEDFAGESAAETDAVEEPVFEEPVIEETAVEEPVFEEPAAEDGADAFGGLTDEDLSADSSAEPAEAAAEELSAGKNADGETAAAEDLPQELSEDSLSLSEEEGTETAAAEAEAFEEPAADFADIGEPVVTEEAEIPEPADDALSAGETAAEAEDETVFAAEEDTAGADTAAEEDTAGLTEEADAGFPTDSGGEYPEEPETAGLTEEADEVSAIPEEISVPKTDDIQEPETVGEEELPAEEEPAADAENPPETENDEAVPAQESEETAPEEAADAVTQIPQDVPIIQDDLAAGITDENLDYLAADEDETIAETAPEEPVSDAGSEIAAENGEDDLPSDIRSEIKSVLLYMDQLLENLPEDKIVEFAKSEQFVTYKKLFSELGLS